MHDRARHERIRASSGKVLMLSFAPLLLAAPAWAGTWIVDDGGGPGVNFTDIPQAIAAATAGDLILVRAGSYSAFTIDKPLVVRGEAGVIVHGDVAIQNLASGSKTALSTCRIDRLVVQNCGGGVILESLQLIHVAGNGLGWPEYVLVDGCDDVRLRACSVLGSTQAVDWDSHTTALHVSNSRVEVVSSILRGEAGNGDDCGIPDFGGSGLECSSGRTHLVLSPSYGGKGGAYGSCSFGAYSGNGGAGVFVAGGAEVILASNAAHQIRGGDAGTDYNGACAFPGGAGHGGNGLNVTGLARYSGVTLLGGSSACASKVGVPLFVGTGGASLQAVPTDPTLALTSPEPGSSFSVELRAPPGATAHLWLGRTMIVEPSTGVVVELLTNKMRLVPLGIVPASGVITSTVNLPPLPNGYILIAQADTVLTTGETRRTNSLAMTVR